MGLVYIAQQRYDEAEEMLLRALAIYEQGMGPDFIMAGRTFSALGDLYHLQGRGVEAEVAYRRAVAIYEQEPDLDNPLIANAFAHLAIFYTEQDRDEEAVSLYQQALGIYERGAGANHPEAVEIRARYDALLTKMTLAQVSRAPSFEPGEQDHGSASCALSSLPQLPALPAIGPLTRREREVLRFLAQGLTSAQISQELTIRVHTVNTHIRSIYHKLNITTRSAATRYALEHRLL